VATEQHNTGPVERHGERRHDETRALKQALALLVAFMAAEIVVAIVSSSLALLADAAHMLTDAAALAVALVAARLAAQPAKGAMTFGLGRAEILSAQASGLTMLVLALIIVYGAISHLVSPSHVKPGPVLAVALAGVAVNLLATRVLGGRHHEAHGHAHGPDQAHHQDAHGHDQAHHQDARGHDRGHLHDVDGHDDHDHEPPRRSLNVEGSYQHMLTDLFGFIATAIAALVIIATGFRRADAIASLLIAAIMLHAAYSLLRASVRVIMEAAPAGFDPNAIGHTLAAQAGVTEVHDLHIWEVTSGFNAVSAHVVVDAGYDCHEVRRQLSRLLADEFALRHSTLQVEHARAAQPPLQIEYPAGHRS
jgi:cobalt-zinc-cadmium efflux system protein